MLKVRGLDSGGRTLGFPGYSVQWQWLSHFRSVVATTFASGVKGPQFETRREQIAFSPRDLHSHWQNEKARKAADATVGGIGDHLKVQESSPPFSAPSPCGVQAQFIPGRGGQG